MCRISGSPEPRNLGELEGLRDLDGTESGWDMTGSRIVNEPQTLSRMLMDISGFDQTYGFELIGCDGVEVQARVAVRPELTDASGAVHGGLYAALAEGMASGGTNWNTTPEGKVGVGMANNSTFIGSITAGFVNGRARRRHDDGEICIWDVEMSDDDGELAALVRVTIAIRPKRVWAPASRSV